MANAVKMLPFPVTSDSAELTSLWGRGIHLRYFGYRISLMMGRKSPKIIVLYEYSLSKRAKVQISQGIIYVEKQPYISDFFFFTKEIP